jgi:hypothetical protein
MVNNAINDLVELSLIEDMSMAISQDINLAYVLFYRNPVLLGFQAWNRYHVEDKTWSHFKRLADGSPFTSHSWSNVSQANVAALSPTCAIP